MDQPKTIDSYIETFPQNVRTLLQQVRNTIKEAAPGAEETISYGLATFKVAGKNLVHFGGFKNHIGFYPTPHGISQFEKELSRYKGAKGSVQFPLDRPVPLDTIRKITLFRLEELQEKGAKTKTHKSV